MIIAFPKHRCEIGNNKVEAHIMKAGEFGSEKPLRDAREAPNAATDISSKRVLFGNDIEKIGAFFLDRWRQVWCVLVCRYPLRGQTRSPWSAPILILDTVYWPSKYGHLAISQSAADDEKQNSAYNHVDASHVSGLKDTIADRAENSKSCKSHKACHCLCPSVVVREWVSRYETG